MKYLIINADDFGYSVVFNAKILKLAKLGQISSTTVMVDWVNDNQTDQINKLSELDKTGKISVGLHLEFSDNNFRAEIERQYENFLTIFKFPPSHIDLHKSTYLEQSYPVILQFCREKNLPCRRLAIGNTDVAQTSQQVINGTAIGLGELKNKIINFAEGESYEILFHPGTYDPDCESSLNNNREEDVRKIEGINKILDENDVKLISYTNLINK